MIDHIGDILKYIKKLEDEGKLEGEGIQLLLHYVETGEDRG